MDKATGIKERIIKTVVDLLLANCRSFTVDHLDGVSTIIDMDERGAVIVCTKEFLENLKQQERK